MPADRIQNCLDGGFSCAHLMGGSGSPVELSSVQSQLPPPHPTECLFAVNSMNVSHGPRVPNSGSATQGLQEEPEAQLLA